MLSENSGSFRGIKLWGDWLNHLIGLGGMLGCMSQIRPCCTTFLMNICLVLAHLPLLVVAPVPLQPSTAAGIRLGRAGRQPDGHRRGARRGCTVGAFFVPVLHASPSGFVMLAGLMIGAVIG